MQSSPQAPTDEELQEAIQKIYTAEELHSIGIAKIVTRVKHSKSAWKEDKSINSKRIRQIVQGIKSSINDAKSAEAITNNTSESQMSGNTESQSIDCVTIHGGAIRYAKTQVPNTHPIFNKRPLPITTKLQYPLVMYRVIENLPRGRSTDNQHATWLTIDPDTGFAPPNWQGGVGDVIVANVDKSPLDVNILGGITDYVSSILDHFGEGEGPPTQMYNRARLDAYIQQSVEIQNNYQRQLEAFRAGGDDALRGWT